MKKQTIRTSAFATAICLVACLLCGCMSQQEKTQQKLWINKLSQVYSDDKFEYLGPLTGENGERYDVARAKSKEYPNEEILVKKVNGLLMSNYNHIRYQEDEKEYIEEYFDGLFECDSFKIEYDPIDPYSPARDYSAEEYVEEYVQFRQVRVTLIKEDGNFLSEEEMAGKILDIAKDRDEVCLITIYCCKQKPKDPAKESECYYHLTMNKERRVESISVASEGGKKRHNVMENVTW